MYSLVDICSNVLNDIMTLYYLHNYQILGLNGVVRKVLRTLDNTVPDLLLKTDITGVIGPEDAVSGAVSGLTEELEHGTCLYSWNTTFRC